MRKQMQNIRLNLSQEIQCPLIALAGDSVADPNWLLGVGLQRGWNSAFDAVFYADNIYNNKSFNGMPPSKDEPMEGEVEWSEHMDNMMNLMTTLGNAARDSQLSEEMDTGMLDEKGPVVNQIRRALKGLKVTPPTPPYVPPVEPWARYKTFQLRVKSNYRGRDLFENKHPLAERELAIFEFNNKYVERGAYLKKTVSRPAAAMLTWPKRFECSAFWGMMDLLEIDGKPAPGKKVLEKTANARPVTPPPPAEPQTPKISAKEVNQIASVKKERLRESIMLQAMTGPAPDGLNKKDRNGLDQLIFAGSARGKKNFTFDDPDEAAQTPVKVQPRRLSQISREAASVAGGTGGGGLSVADLSAIVDLTETLKAVLEKYDAAEKKLDEAIKRAESKLGE